MYFLIIIRWAINCQIAVNSHYYQVIQPTIKAITKIITWIN